MAVAAPVGLSHGVLANPTVSRTVDGGSAPFVFIPPPLAAIVFRRMTEPGKVLATFTVNGEPHEVAFPPHKTLLEVLREEMNLTGTKHGCELGECGTCTVLVDGKPVLSCLLLGLNAVGHAVTTVEGMAEGGDLHPLQQAFVETGAAQCGYCTPGFLLASKALLDEEPSPSRERLKCALAGNPCRCTGYLKIYEAVELAAGRMAAARGRNGGR